MPIFKKSYELYKEFYLCLKNFPKSDKHALGQKCELALADLLENLLKAMGASRPEKAPYLDQASAKLNLTRVYLRLAKDIRALDANKYVALQASVDEIGRMLGGWKKSL